MSEDKVARLALANKASVIQHLSPQNTALIPLNARVAV